MSIETEALTALGVPCGRVVGQAGSPPCGEYGLCRDCEEKAKAVDVTLSLAVARAVMNLS